MEFDFESNSMCLSVCSSLMIFAVLYFVSWKRDDIADGVVTFVGVQGGGARKQIGGAINNLAVYVFVGVILSVSLLVMMRTNPALKYSQDKRKLEALKKTAEKIEKQIEITGKAVETDKQALEKMYEPAPANA